MMLFLGGGGTAAHNFLKFLFKFSFAVLEEQKKDMQDMAGFKPFLS